MDKRFKDILPNKDPYHNRGRDQMRKKGGPEFECLWSSLPYKAIEKSIKNAISIWCRWNACPFADWLGNEILISGKQSELGVGCFSKLKHMSSPPPFLLLDSSIHAQIISQLEGGDIIMQINDSKECFKEI